MEEIAPIKFRKNVWAKSATVSYFSSYFFKKKNNKKYIVSHFEINRIS